ncbi:unnamed protein product (macronuclear) [Paramecium tetraurelia]|uniref:G domain-containing protein n=1 Tax=Paramecium tetraurelia TaxID=5888 RepID=A0E351_PARTE|nr:uncharacterized protein GSPATT00022891001 [Paramecium tetraurelia]CAK89718.1 unnamed protein product [Paramecium tetraurelia]|eukprot:XP_001457115.1 hypothetical protein (macronuclear) [Paramecium tetraurelia strain d4-2]
MEQQIVQEEANFDEEIQHIFDDYEYINNNTNGEFPEIPNGSIVLIFLGEFQQNFHTFYQHFQIKQVILDTNYYKLVRLEKQGKKSYLLNFPLILQYNYETNQIPLDLCISKIYAEKALQKMGKCKFQLVIDMQQLNGDDERAKMDSMIQDSVAYFGKYSFKKKSYLLLGPQDENIWKLCKVELSDKNNYSQQFQPQGINQNKVLQSIFRYDSYQSLNNCKSDDLLNYGKMMTYLSQKENILTKYFNYRFKEFQKLLLILQQMPIILYQDNTMNIVERYLKELQNRIKNIQICQQNKLSKLKEILKIINQINQGNEAKELNEIIQLKNSRQMKQFMQENQIEQISIHPFFNDQDLQKLDEIIQFWETYYKKFVILEAKNLEINLKFWRQYCHQAIESTLYELKYIVKRIQEGPKNPIENGIYFIGVTKSGKSTVMNAIFYPDKLEQTRILGKKCYKIGQEQDPKFQIGQGGVSMTQKISGIYIGEKEELNQIFYNQNNGQNINQQQEDVFSYQELLYQGLINELKIPERSFIFDCPGFEDNQNELMRIAHRISLYNYFKKTKNIIVYVLIDISVQQIENIKNTFDPIYSLLKDKRDLDQNFRSWGNLILTKAEKDSRKVYLEQWDLAYYGLLEQNYSYYKKHFSDDEICLEFFRPSEEMHHDVKKFAESINVKIQRQLQQKNDNNNPIFELQLDERLWMQYSICMPKIQLKLKQFFKLFSQYFDEYFSKSEDTLSQKFEQIKIIKDIFQNITAINVNNCVSILQRLSEWINKNEYTKSMSFFLESYIQDIKTIFQISEYCKNKQSINPFVFKIDKIVIQIQKTHSLIEKMMIVFQVFKNVGPAILGITLLTGGWAYLSSVALFHHTLLCYLVAGTSSLAAISTPQRFFEIFQSHLFQIVYQAN